MNDNKNILISGAGIAGTTLAFWLKKFGFNPTIVEHAPKLREGGYGIDFWGVGFDVAERMNIVDDLKKSKLGIEQLIFVDEHNKRKAKLSYTQIIKLLKGRGLSLLRSSLAKVIYNHLDKDIEIIFGDTITDVNQSEDGVDVTFKSGKKRKFDLLIGADGLHSNVRNLVFGDESQFELYYGYYAASFTIQNYPSDGQAFLTYNAPNKQVTLYTIDDKTSTAFFIFSSPEKLHYDYHDTEAQKQILRNRFENIGWKCNDVLSKMDASPDFYFDVVSQIQMNRWSKNRITLVGDACDCPSLLSGQGSTLAMVGAYILAGELKNANGDYIIAYQRYQDNFKSFINKKQLLAQKFAKSFVPKSNFGIWIRNIVVHFMSIPYFTKMFVKSFSDDELSMKEY